MKLAKTTLVVAVVLLALLTGLLVKAHYFPAIKDAYFVPDSDRLRQVPTGILTVRPTHFTPSIHDGIKHVHDNDALTRTVGRDVTLRSLMAEAYDTDPAQVVLPLDAPTNGFDFLATTSQHTRRQLQGAVRKDLGYVAHHETRSVPVLVLKVKDPSLPGLVISPDSEAEDVHYQDGRLYFKHEPIHVVLKGLENGLSLPVQDQTGLTNCYDFSVLWNKDIQQRSQTGGFNLDGVKAVLNNWGLQLDPDTDSLDMLVVEKTP